MTSGAWWARAAALTVVVGALAAVEAAGGHRPWACGLRGVASAVVVAALSQPAAPAPAWTGLTARLAGWSVVRGALTAALWGLLYTGFLVVDAVWFGAGAGPLAASSSTWTLVALGALTAALTPLERRWGSRWGAGWVWAAGAAWGVLGSWIALAAGTYAYAMYGSGGDLRVALRALQALAESAWAEPVPMGAYVGCFGVVLGWVAWARARIEGGLRAVWAVGLGVSCSTGVLSAGVEPYLLVDVWGGSLAGGVACLLGARLVDAPSAPEEPID